jgi:ferredoxin-type protein NapG
MQEDRSMNRRRFFREGLLELFRPLAGAADKFAEVANQIGNLEELAAAKQKAVAPTPVPQPAPEAALAPVLRPPGAVSESMMTNICSRCGECTRVCPAQAIKLDPWGSTAGGVPYIDPDDVACAVCEGLACMSHCPTGTLVITAREEIDMGTAVWHEDTCHRRDGGDCTICVDHCPLGPAAIVLREGRIEVIEDGCIGCGVCQHDCPSYPKSITVTPADHEQPMD